jgi:hypothetical protein
MLFDFNIKNGFVSVSSDSFDYGFLEYSLKDRQAVETLQKQMIADNVYPDNEMIGDLRSDSFGEAFDYTDNVKTVSIGMPKTPDDIAELAEKLIDFAETWRKNPNLVFHFH